MGRFGDDFRLTLITNDPALAARADAAGINLIGVDTERLNKSARQGHIENARISDHELSDLARLAPVVRNASLFARLNPLNDRSNDEIEAALANGAAALMLPFFTTAAEVETFARHVDGRAKVILLVETAAAVVRLHDILAVAGIDEVIVGLNDLHLSTGVAHHFELVASDLMTTISDQVRGRGLRFGFGGLPRAFDDSLPVSSDLVLAQHARLGSTAAWISRSFLGRSPESLNLTAEVVRLRKRLTYWAERTPDELLAQRDALRRHVRSLVAV